MQKNDQIIATCENYTYDGSGVVKVDGFPLFVSGLIVKEKALIQVIKCKKTYGYGKVIKLIEASEERVEPKCPLFHRCGGCHLQHMSQREQRRFKQEQVQQLMKRVAKNDLVVPEVIDMQDPYYYRNKAQIPVGLVDDQVVMGFYRTNSNVIIDHETCCIQSKAINEIAQDCKHLIEKYKIAKNLRHVLIKDAFSTNEIMVVLISRKPDMDQLDAFVAELCKRHGNICSVILNVNDRNDNVILGDKETVLYGSDHIIDELSGLKFQISSKSFYQVNPLQTIKLYEQALAYADLNGSEEVLDLYCGVGTISLFMAKHASHVTGIEIVEKAIDDAILNAQMNHMSNVDFICEDASSYAKSLVDENKVVDVVMIDPPRKGCDEASIQSIVAMKPNKVVYISCDPSTLARDLYRFNELGYVSKAIQNFDLFPQSYHIESVVLLTRESA
ncbi:MAG: 23S rRNA (uracil(1939)-C(5))-methyltransferase RlmD [Erysipelotrichaceae bacterium]